jgi:hypothetical protein
MPIDARPQPVEIRVAKFLGPGIRDVVTRKAVLETMANEVAALFRARRRVFRVISGTPDENGLTVEATMYQFDVGERTLNGQEVAFGFGIGAWTRRGSSIAERHYGWDRSNVDPSQPFPIWAARLLQSCVRREVGDFVDDCETWVDRRRNR